MGFMDGLKKLTQPYDDDEDFFEGADQSLRPQPKPEQKAAVSAAQMAFENAFADQGGTPVPAEEAQPKKPAESSGGIFGGFKKAAQSASRPKRERTVNFGGKDTSVLLFSPKTFDEAGELVSYLQQDMTCVMTLETVPAETARRLLDFLSGIGGSEKHHAANEQKNQKNGKDHAHFRPVDRVLLETLALNTARWSRVDMRDLARAGLSVDGGTVDAVHGQAIILGERFTLCVIHVLCCIHGDLPGRGGAGCRVHPGSACALALKGDRRL